MENKATSVCFEMTVPPEYEGLAIQRAIDENPANASPFDAALLRSRFWGKTRLLRVRFLNGIPIVQRKVEEYAHQWSQDANIAFEFGNYPDAQLRIAFEEEGPSRSTVGTNALAVPMNEPTMILADLTPYSSEMDYSSVVLHEFGHALGLIHEHQSSAVNIQWNKQAVLQYAMQYFFPDWPQAEVQVWVEHNIFRHYTHRELGTKPTPFDPLSIMLYPIPKEWTLNGFETRMNTTLSQTDKSYIRKNYP